jgi:hypothetical protein
MAYIIIIIIITLQQNTKVVNLIRILGEKHKSHTALYRSENLSDTCKMSCNLLIILYSNTDSPHLAHVLSRLSPFKDFTFNIWCVTLFKPQHNLARSVTSPVTVTLCSVCKYGEFIVLIGLNFSLKSAIALWRLDSGLLSIEIQQPVVCTTWAPVFPQLIAEENFHA